MDETLGCRTIRYCPAAALNFVNARDADLRLVFHRCMRLACAFLGSLNRVVRTASLAAAFYLSAMSPSAAHPYSIIVDRNPFGLKDPPRPQPIEPKLPPRPAPTLVLTGVADFSTDKWAFITRTDPGARPKHYTLTVGETEGGLQLLEIDAPSASVKLRVDGLETVALKLASATNQLAKPPPSPAKFPPVRGVSFPRVR